jgi:hypothetical protein
LNVKQHPIGSGTGKHLKRPNLAPGIKGVEYGMVGNIVLESATLYVLYGALTWH